MARGGSSRQLIVDASVGRAAGPEGAQFPTSKRCRDTLSAILRICHRVVMTEALQDEWRRHRSSFARKWLTSMYARRKVVSLEVEPDEVLRARLSELRAERQAEALLKDAHLVEAAWASDGRVLSLDEAVRRLLSPLVDQLPRLNAIAWVNPDRDEEAVITWLEQGAPAEPGRRLGALEESGAARSKARPSRRRT